MSDIILTDKAVGSQENKNENYENEKLESKKEENEDYENKDEDDGDKTIDQNKIIKGKNDDLDEMIDKSKSFEDQIE